MPIIREKDWQEYVDKNQDPYGKGCVDIARKVMQLLDEEPDTPIEKGWGHFGVSGLIIRAQESIGEREVTAFMAGAVAKMVSVCHSRGEEFRKIWNLDTQIGNEGEKANLEGNVLNPGILKRNIGG